MPGLPPRHRAQLAGGDHRRGERVDVHMGDVSNPTQVEANLKVIIRVVVENDRGPNLPSDQIAIGRERTSCQTE